MRGFLLQNSGREQKTHGRLFCTYEIVYNPRTFDRNSLRSAATANARTAVLKKHKRQVYIELLTFLLYTVKGESDKAQLLITIAFCYLGKEI